MEITSSQNPNIERITKMKPIHFLNKPWRGALQMNLRSIKSLNAIWFEIISYSEILSQKSRLGHLRLATVIRLSKKAQILSLHYRKTALIDNECSDLSQSLKGLTSLQSISLGFWGLNKTTDVGIYKLSQGLKELSSLGILEFSVSECPNITDKSCYYLSQGMKRLYSLQNLSLSFSKTSSITDRGLDYLGQGVKRLSSLEYISLIFKKCEQITDVGFSSLCKSLRNLGNLWSLHLAFWPCNKISDAGLSHLSDLLRRLDRLKRLALKIKSNEITDFGMKSLGNGLKSLRSLQTLVLEIECPQVSDSGFICLDAVLMALRPFSHLYVSFNNDRNPEFDSAIDFQSLGQWNNKEVNSLGKTLKTLTCLQLSVLKFEWIENEFPTDQGLKTLRSLRQIELKLRYGGPINDHGLKSLGEELKKHPLLSSITIDLERADLTDVGVQSFCEEISNLPLRKLYLYTPKYSKVTNKGRYMMLECLKGISSLKYIGFRDESGFLTFLNRQKMDEFLEELGSSLLRTEGDEEKKAKKMIEAWKDPGPSESNTEDDEEKRTKKKKSSILLKGIYMLFFCVILYIFSRYLF